MDAGRKLSGEARQPRRRGHRLGRAAFDVPPCCQPVTCRKRWGLGSAHKQSAVPFRWNEGSRAERSDLPPVVRSDFFGVCVMHPPSQTGFPAPDSRQKKFNSRLVVPSLYGRISVSEGCRRMSLSGQSLGRADGFNPSRKNRHKISTRARLATGLGLPERAFESCNGRMRWPVISAPARHWCWPTWSPRERRGFDRVYHTYRPCKEGKVVA